MNARRISAAICALGLGLLYGGPARNVMAAEQPGAVAGAGAGVRIAPPGSRPDGRGYPAWIAAWLRWAVGTTAAHHPLLDKGDCAVNQAGKVWFLGGSFTTGGSPIVRDCTVPNGTALFFPIANEFYISTPKVACIPRDPWYGATPQDKAYALFRKNILNAIRPPKSIRVLSLEVDGRSAGRLTNYFARSPVLSIRVPDNNIFSRLGYCGSQPIPGFLSTPDVSWGHYVFLEPLPPGRHTVRWKAVEENTVFYPKLKQVVTYHITVEPG